MNTTYKQALLDAKKEIEELEKIYGAIKPKDVYEETFQYARLMGYDDAIYRIEQLLEKCGADDYPLAKNTKERIDTYIANNFITDKVVKTDVNAIVHAMKEGVRLGKEEMKEEAVDGYVSVGRKRRLISILDCMKKFKYGDKIKAIIFKD